MSTFTINIRTDNAAYRNEDGSLYAFGVRETVLEALRKLIDKADRVERGGVIEFFLRDANGNRVGEMVIDEDMPRTVSVCTECGSALCSAQYSSIIEMTLADYEAIERCPDCERIEGFCNCGENEEDD